MAIEVASAYVSLIPSARGFRTAVERELGGTDATGFGEEAGEQYSTGFGSKLTTAGVLIGGTFAAGLLKGTFDALDRGAQNDLLASQLGLDPTEAERVGDVSSSLYAGAWGENLEEVNAAVRGIYSELNGQTLSTDELEKLTAYAIDLGRIMDADVNEVMRATSAILSNELAPDAESAFDMLTAASQQFGVRGDDLADTFAEYSNQFADFGLSGRDALDLMAVALENGARNTDGVADGLKETFLGLVGGSAPVTEALDEIGLSLEDMQALINQGEGGEALSAISRALGEVDSQVDRSRLAAILFGTTYEQIGLEGVASMGDFEGALKDIEGAAADASSSLNDNLSTRIEALKRRGFQALADIAERVVIPALEGMFAAIDAISAAFSEGGLGGVIDLVADKLGFLGDYAPIIIGALTAFGVVVLATVVPAFIAWASAAGAAAIATIAANAPLLLIAAIIGAVAAAVIWAYQNSETFRRVVDFLADVFKTKVLPALKAVGNWIVDNLVPAFISIVGWIADNIIPVIGDFIGWLVDLAAKGIEVAGDILDFFTDMVDAVKELPGKIADAAKNVWDGLLTPFEIVVDKIRDLWNSTIGGFSMTVPDWVPEFGGRGFTVPRLHSGGIVPGASGAESLFILQAGEEVIDARTRAALAGPDGSVLTGRAGSGAGYHIETVNVINRPFYEELAEAAALRPVPV